MRTFISSLYGRADRSDNVNGPFVWVRFSDQTRPPMTRTLLIAVLIAASSAAAPAQVKTIPGQMKTATVTIEAIDRTRREVTVKQEDGTHNIIVVPKEVTRFDAMA